MDMKKNTKAVLITGGTKRIGLSLAGATVEMGYNVILHFRSSDRYARRWLHRNPRFKDRVFFIRHDLSDSPETVIEKALMLPCSLTGLVNNASNFSSGSLDDPVHFEEMVNIHLLIPARLGAFFYRRVKKGWIINISDALSQKISIRWQNYRLSKLFLEHLTRHQAIRFAPDCRVNAIAPGAVIPPNDKEGRNVFKKLAGITPLRKTGSVSSLIKAYRFLVDNSDCTGEIISVDGGLRLTA